MAVVNINRHVRQIPQPRGSTKCWAACIAMVLHRHGASTDAIVNAVVAEARSNSVGLHDNLSLKRGAVPRLAQAFHLAHWERPASMPAVLPATFMTALHRSAAIALGLLLRGDAGEHQHHAVALDGLHGDTEQLLHINLHGVDPLIPAGGGAFDRTVAGFQNFMRIEHLVYRA
jgi:hypothetical protein